MTLNFRKIYKDLGLKKNDKVLLASSLLGISILYKNKKKVFDPNIVLDEMQYTIGKKGTLLLNAFNWEFCKKKKFDYKKTKSLSGHLSNLALSRNDFLRTQNPIYSFAVSGKDKKKIFNFKHRNCFDLNSPFGYMINNKAKGVFIDIDYKKTGFALVHAAEQKCKVKYRYLKSFTGQYLKNNKKKIITVKMFVKKLNLGIDTLITEAMDERLNKLNAIKTIKRSGIKFTLIDLKQSFYLMVKDLNGKKKFIKTKKIN